MLSDQTYNSLQRSQNAILTQIAEVHDEIEELLATEPLPPQSDRTVTTYLDGSCTTFEVWAPSFFGQTTPFSVAPWATYQNYIDALMSLDSGIPTSVHYNSASPSTIQAINLSTGGRGYFTQTISIADEVLFGVSAPQIRPFIPSSYLYPVITQEIATNADAFTHLSTVLAPLANMSRMYQYLTNTPSNFFTLMPIPTSGSIQYRRDLTHIPCACTKQILFTLKKGMYYAVTASFHWTGDFPYFRSLEMAVYFPSSLTTPGSETTSTIPRFYGTRLKNAFTNIPNPQQSVSVTTPPRYFLANSDAVFINIAGYFDLFVLADNQYCTGTLTVVQL